MTAPQPEPGPFDAVPQAATQGNAEAGLMKRLTQLTDRFTQRGIAKSAGPGRLFSMRLPGHPHPVACSLLSPLEDQCGTEELKLDLQRGGLEARALAITGCTTELEADIIGRTLVYTMLEDAADAPMPDFERSEGQFSALKFHELPLNGCVARDPGLAPRAMEFHEQETLGYGLVGVIAAFDAESLNPPEVDSGDDTILEITVKGTRAKLIAAESLGVTWKEVPFRPYPMPSFRDVKLDSRLREIPQERQESWILHSSALAMSDMETRMTYQTLMAIDDRSGQILGTEMLEGRGGKAFAEAFAKMVKTVGHRPGSVMVTSPRLDGMFGKGLRRIGIRYTQGRMLRADDPRVSDVEDFFRGCQNEILDDMIESGRRARATMAL